MNFDHFWKGWEDVTLGDSRWSDLMAWNVTSTALYCHVSIKREDFVLSKNVRNAAGDQFVHMKLILAGRIKNTGRWLLLDICANGMVAPPIDVCVPPSLWLLAMPALDCWWSITSFNQLKVRWKMMQVKEPFLKGTKNHVFLEHGRRDKDLLPIGLKYMA